MAAMPDRFGRDSTSTPAISVACYECSRTRASSQWSHTLTISVFAWYGSLTPGTPSEPRSIVAATSSPIRC